MQMQFEKEFSKIKSECIKEVEKYIADNKNNLYNNIGLGSININLGYFGVKFEHKSGIQRATEFLKEMKFINNKEDFCLAVEKYISSGEELRDILINHAFSAYDVTQQMIYKAAHPPFIPDQETAGRRIVFENIIKGIKNQGNDEQLDLAYQAGGL